MLKPNYKIITNKFLHKKNFSTTKGGFSDINRLLGISNENIKKKDSVLYVTLESFLDIKHMLGEFTSITEAGSRYSIIPRISYMKRKKISEWKSLGDQIGFSFVDSKEYDSTLPKILCDIKVRLNYFLELYDIDIDYVTGLQFIINKVVYTNKVVELKKFEKESLGAQKELINVTQTTKVINKILPLTMNTSTFGKLLYIEAKNGFVEYITLIDGKKIDFINRINKFLGLKKEHIRFDDKTLFYQTKHDYIIIVKVVNNKNLLYIYSIDGIEIQRLVDEKMDTKDHFKRTINNVTLFINKQGVYNKEIYTQFKSIYPNRIPTLQSRMMHPDWMIGTLDIETYKTSVNTSQAYAIGFYADNKANVFYIENYLDSTNLILRCIRAMLVEKYHKYIFYVHNLGGYDAIYILKALIENNEQNQWKLDYKLICRDDLILSIDISSKLNNKRYTIKLVDSLNLLQSSLDKLCVTFDTDVKKTIFPYNFISKNTIFYKGVKPDLKYFNFQVNSEENSKEELNLTLEGKILKLEKEICHMRGVIEKFTEYCKLPATNYSVQIHTMEYLRNDLISLFKVIEIFQRNIYIEYNTQISNSLTITGLALDIFLRRFYSIKNIPLISKNSIYHDIRESYYGGITEVYRPHGINLSYYDVNSLYPFSALNDMPGLNCIYRDNINKNIKDCLDIFGFFYCSIKTSDKYIGLIPTRGDEGIKMPLGFIEGWYFSEELKFAYSHGYVINIVKGYQFDRTKDVFKKYVEEFYRIKSETKDKVMRSIAKSLLNNLLGRFGMILDKSVTELVTKDQFKELQQYKKIKSVKYIGDKLLVTHGSEVSPVICKQHNVDYIITCQREMKEKIESKVFKETEFNNVSIAIASAVTAYSRIYMNKIKLDILNKKGSIYYTDTDSIVTDVELDGSLIGSEIGKFKKEHSIIEGYFIGCKTYSIKDLAGTIIIKAKGANKNELSFSDFEKLYSGLNVPTTRYETIKDYSLGCVAINVPKSVVLSATMYNKRVKIFKDNKWIDTKPIKIESKNYSSISYSKGNLYFMDCLLKVVLIFILQTFLLLLPVFIILSLICINHEFIEQDVVTDLVNEYNSCIDNSNINESININDNNGRLNTRDIFKDFTKPFTHKNKKLNSNFQSKTSNINNTIDSTRGDNNITPSTIINELKDDSRYNIHENEIQKLKEEVSILKIELLRSNINKLDLIKDLDIVLNRKDK